MYYRFIGKRKLIHTPHAYSPPGDWQIPTSRRLNEMLPAHTVMPDTNIHTGITLELKSVFHNFPNMRSGLKCNCYGLLL